MCEWFNELEYIELKSVVYRRYLKEKKLNDCHNDDGIWMVKSFQKRTGKSWIEIGNLSVVAPQ